MTPIQSIYPVTAEGIGRQDYTQCVQRSTSQFHTAALRQAGIAFGYSGLLPTVPWPNIYAGVVVMPQDDGSWDYGASTIIVHFMEMSITIGSNCLVVIGLARFASLADLYIWNVAEYFPRIYGYGRAKIQYTNGITSQPGSVYATVTGFYSSNPTEHYTGMCTGLVTDLTIPWM